MKMSWLVVHLVARNFENSLITLSEKHGVRLPSEIIWGSKFFIWFLFTCVLWASEFGRMPVLIHSNDQGI